MGLEVLRSGRRPFANARRSRNLAFLERNRTSARSEIASRWKLTGHQTASVFRRYDIVSPDDLRVVVRTAGRRNRLRVVLVALGSVAVEAGNRDVVFLAAAALGNGNDVVKLDFVVLQYPAAGLALVVVTANDTQHH
jgi:hypothetical protein